MRTPYVVKNFLNEYVTNSMEFINEITFNEIIFLAPTITRFPTRLFFGACDTWLCM